MVTNISSLKFLEPAENRSFQNNQECFISEDLVIKLNYNFRI